MALGFRSAAELVAAIRRREVGCRELLEACLSAVERHNPTLNAVVTLDADRARRRADEADRALVHGAVVGPLHGLPITVKDSFETAGLRTTCGYPPLAEHVPAADATAVARLVAAGAIVFGKTNTPVLASDWQSYNPLFGATSNPWALDRTPGGSSGGAAAALAAGLTPVELGSDIGGSVRIPAAWCGVYGHKPTHGIIPLRGHIPGPPGTLAEVDLGVAGPLARHPQDLALLLDVLAGPDADRAVAWRLALPPPRRAALEGYRVAAWLDDPAARVDRAVRACLEGAVASLRRAGVRVDDRARPAVDLAHVIRTYETLAFPILMAGLPAEQFDALVRLAAEARADVETPAVRSARRGTIRHRDWLVANEARMRVRGAMTAFFREWDALLMPVVVVPAVPHDHSEPFAARTIVVDGRTRSYYDLFAWIALATMALLPATVVPAGRTPDGLPVGLQIVGPYLEDRTPLDLARRLVDVVGGFVPPPGYAS